MTPQTLFSIQLWFAVATPGCWHLSQDLPAKSRPGDYLLGCSSPATCKHSHYSRQVKRLSPAGKSPESLRASSVSDLKRMWRLG